MDCTEVRNLVDGYADGEVGLADALQIEKHLNGCADCSAALENIRILKRGLNDASLFFEPSRGLRKDVAAAIRAESKRRIAFAGRPLRVVGLAASFALLGVVVWTAAVKLGPGSGASGLTREIVDSHIRSLMASHLTDVVSSDKHTVKPWFNGKIDFSPNVPDLAAAGFPLDGGRLDYLSGRPVAALAYHHRLHVINLFVWRSGAEPPGSSTEQGYNLVSWSDAGLLYAAVSDLNVEELRQFVELYRK